MKKYLGLIILFVCCSFVSVNLRLLSVLTGYLVCLLQKNVIILANRDFSFFIWEGRCVKKVSHYIYL